MDLVRDVQKRRAARQNNKDSPTPTGGSSSGNLDLGLVGALAGDSIGDEDSPATCFICNERLYGSLEDINSHIDACLTNPQPAHHVANASGPSRGNTPASNSGRSSVATTPSTHVVDSFEEYTWAGQTRVRATALFEGGMGSLGSGSRSVQEDIDDDLDIEDDEEDEYGGAQFTERDVVQNEVDPDAEELREIVIASSSAVQRPPSPPPRQRKLAVSSTPSSSFDREVDIEDMGDDPGDVDDTVIDEDAEIDLEGDGDENGDAVEEEDERESDRVNALISSAFASGDTKLVIEALRAKIKHLESANKNAPTCLICLDPYTVPLTSIVCWHVHCEACWMKTLGSKKLCPQCQKITLPKDLRRIYL
ncbi:hypothetical protein BGZ83_012119 [Gryganskiella cystojenkinii]|nr:hypothetical protein BGZ83_012119 [Gryganskiella cystojenkinii]